MTSTETLNVLSPEYMAEVRLSLNPDYPEEKLASEHLAPERIGIYRDALAKMVADVDDQLAARAARSEELEETEPGERFTEYDERYVVWRRKALDFKRHVSARLREVNATIKAANRSKDDAFRQIKAERNEAVLLLAELLHAVDEHGDSFFHDDYPTLLERCRTALTSYETSGATAGRAA